MRWIVGWFPLAGTPPGFSPASYWTHLDTGNKKNIPGLFPKPLNISLGNPPGFANLIGGNIFGPNGPIDRFRVDPQKIGHFGDRQKLTRSWLELDSPISGEWFAVRRHPGPYFVRDLARKGITPSRLCPTEMHAIITKRLERFHVTSEPFICQQN